MSSESETQSPTNGAGPGHEHRPAGQEHAGWLTALRTKLGLHGSTLRDTIEDALKADQGGGTAFSAAERVMLGRLLRFGAQRVDDVMVPRADIIAIDEEESVRELLRLFDDAEVSRIPVFRETLDNPRGMVHIKDLLSWIVGGGVERQGTDPAAARAAGSAPPPVNKRPIKASDIDLSRADLSRSIASTRLRRPVLYVPPSMPAMNLLIRMQSSHIHMAIVVDEYGGTDGLVSIEDLVEQVVGQIEDEHDEAEVPHIVEDPKLGLIASARTPVAELEQRLGLKLLAPGEEEDIDTLGGLVFSALCRVPARGELIRHPSGVEFEVLDADPRRVKRLKIHAPKAGHPDRAGP